MTGAEHLPIRRPTACSWCGQPLSALRAMRRDVCERPSCLQQHDRRMLRESRARVAADLRAQQVPRLGRERADALRVLWIEPHATRLVDMPEDVRRTQLDHLARVAHLAADEGAPAAPPAVEATAVPRAAAGLCGWCAGRCCRFGADHHAYLEAGHLLRWALAGPGRTLDGAVAAYAERLPARHVEGSCPYHGERGCALEREMRSDTCNRHACDGLRELRSSATAAPQADWLFVMGARAEVLGIRLDTRGD